MQFKIIKYDLKPRLKKQKKNKRMRFVPKWKKKVSTKCKQNTKCKTEK